jgi:hypothetical protein
MCTSTTPGCVAYLAQADRGQDHEEDEGDFARWLQKGELSYCREPGRWDHRTFIYGFLHEEQIRKEELDKS